MPEQIPRVSLTKAGRLRRKCANSCAQHPDPTYFSFFAFTHILAHVFARLFLHICVRFLHSNFCVFRTRSSPTHPKQCVFVIFVRFLKKKTFWQQHTPKLILYKMHMPYVYKMLFRDSFYRGLAWPSIKCPSRPPYFIIL